MSGGKNKSSVAQAPAMPGALPGPILNVAPPAQPIPGQMDTIAQQLGQAYPSMPPAQLQQHLQAIYAPPMAAPAAASPTAAAIASASGQGLGDRKLSKAQEWEEMLMRRSGQG